MKKKAVSKPSKAKRPVNKPKKSANSPLKNKKSHLMSALKSSGAKIAKPSLNLDDKKIAELEKENLRLGELVEILSRGKYQWESTFDAITSPVQIVSKDFNIVRANRAVASLVGKDIKKMIGGHCFEEFAGRDKPCEDCPMKGASEHGARCVFVLGNSIGGREFEVCAYPAPSALPDMVIMHYRDVTEERRLQREVIQQEKMAAIGMLAGGVAHEINNPLGGIIAFTQLLKRDPAVTDERVKSDLDSIEEAALRCKKIVANLLDFSRSSRENETRRVDLNVILEKVFPFIRREMRSQNVELVFDGAGSLPSVVGAADRLQQVFINLMTNACHAMEKGGVLTVKTSVTDGGEYVVVSVKDTGVGIPQALRGQIFDPFFTTKEPGKGTGLGLSISYRIIKDHKGTITFRDVPEGGTEFVVRLPAARD